MNWRRKNDRRVHAVVGDGSEIVRYDVGGKWYREWPASSLIPRKRLAVAEAAALVSSKAQWNARLPGGATFDRLVRERLGGAE